MEWWKVHSDPFQLQHIFCPQIQLLIHDGVFCVVFSPRKILHLSVDAHLLDLVLSITNSLFWSVGLHPNSSASSCFCPVFFLLCTTSLDKVVHRQQYLLLDSAFQDASDCSVITSGAFERAACVVWIQKPKYLDHFASTSGKHGGIHTRLLRQVAALLPKADNEASAQFPNLH